VANEIKSHTSLRGIAALFVAVLHFRAVLKPALDIDQYTSLFAKSYLWVDFFFILSGFILCRVYQKALFQPFATREFFVARFARIYPLHIATLLLLAAWQVVALSGSRTIGNWDTFALNVLNIHAWGFLSAYDWNYPSWSISAEFAAYLLFPGICIAMRWKMRIALLGMCLLLLTRVGYLLVADDPRENWERLALFECLPMFFLGVILHQAHWIDLKKIWIAVIQIAAAISILVVMHLGLNDALIFAPFAMLVFFTQMDTGILARALTWRPLVVLGEWSYSIYMLHACILIVSYMVWPKFVAIPLGLSDQASAAGRFATLLIVTLVAAGCSYMFFEKPMRKAIRQVRLGTAPAIAGIDRRQHR
jgi:peptidoglycan/LPS O-acetylase OafA/YrhL